MSDTTDNKFDIEDEINRIEGKTAQIDDSAFATLLPVATLEIFTQDENTASALNALRRDWRFARVKTSIHEGDVNSAIDHFKTASSPDLLIIQTDNIDEDFVAKLETLSGSCDDDTYAVVIGPVNDVYLYRELIAMGVSDYLVRPVDTNTIANIIAKALIEQIGISESELIAVIGSKGGVGTSTISQMIAGGIVKRFDQKTMLVDLAGGSSINPIRYSYNPSTNLPEVLRIFSNENERDYISRVIINPLEKLDMLSTGGDVILNHNPGATEIENMINIFMEKYPVTIADLSGVSPTVAKTVLARASSIVIVTSPAISSVSITETLYSEIKSLRGGSANNIYLIMNMEGISPSGEVSKKDINYAIGCECAEAIAFNPSIFINSEENGTKFFENKTIASYSIKLASLFKDKFEKHAETQKDNKKSDDSLMSNILKVLTKDKK